MEPSKKKIAEAAPAAPTAFKVVMRRDMKVGAETIAAGTVIGELKLSHPAVTTNVLFAAVQNDFATTE